MSGDAVARENLRAWLILRAIDAETLAGVYTDAWQQEESAFWREQALTYRRLHDKVSTVSLRRP